MFQTCMFCNRPLGANEVIAAISDSLLLPTEAEDFLEKHRGGSMTGHGGGSVTGEDPEG